MSSLGLQVTRSVGQGEKIHAILHTSNRKSETVLTTVFKNFMQMNK